MAVRYDQETKDKAIKLSDEIGIKAAAEQLGLSEKTIWYFRSARKKTEKKLAEAKKKYVIEPPDLEKEVADNPYVSFTKSKDDDRIFKRGQVYYIFRSYVIGNELAKGRPGIIISNDRDNEHNGVVTVVLLTSKIKEQHNSRVCVSVTGRVSTVMADQITTVDISRIGDYIGECTPAEIDAVDNAIIAALGLERHTAKCMSDDQIIARMTAIKAERDAYERQFDKLLSKFIKMGGAK